MLVYQRVVKFKHDLTNQTGDVELDVEKTDWWKKETLAVETIAVTWSSQIDRVLL